MKNRILIIATLVAFTGLWSWMGCSSDETSEDTGSLVGTVALEGADDFSGTEVTAGNQSRTTDGDGSYEFDDLWAGYVEVSAKQDGYAAQTETVEIVAGKQSELDFELPVENQPPVVEAVTVEPGVLEPNAVATLDVVATSPHDDELTYQWDAPDNWSVHPDDEPVAELTAPDDVDAQATISIVVEDEFGGQATGTVDVKTSEGNAPEITDLSIAPPQAEPGGEMELSVEAHDPDGGELTYQWSTTSDWGVIDAESPQTTLVAPDEYGATGHVDIAVTDEYGLSTIAEVIVSTVQTVGPSVSSFSASPSIVDRGDTSQLEIVASHPYEEVLSYEWNVDNPDWNFIAGAGSGDDTATIEAPDIPDSSVTVTVEADDGLGGTTTSSVMITTPGTSPVIIYFDIDPADWVERNGTADITVDANHPDGDSLYYDWNVTDDWNIDGSVGDDNEAQLTAPDISDDYATIEVTVEDDWEESDTYTFDIRTQDTEPAPFEFEDTEGVRPFQPIVSNAVEITDFDGPVNAECTDCELSVNDGAFASAYSGVHPGDTIKIRRESGGTEETVNASVTVGDTASAQWSITTTSWEGIREFTTCGEEGRFGPSQQACDVAYDGTLLEGEISIDVEGIQRWTVPQTGTYEITTYGARAGLASDAADPGAGAVIQAELSLEEGEELHVAVGQTGVDGEINTGAGGGTFVFDANDNPLVIAGGGGGVSHHVSPSPDPGNTGTMGTPAVQLLLGHGEDGEGGEVPPYSTWAAGSGAGFLSNGSNIPGQENKCDGACACDQTPVEAKGILNGGVGARSNDSSPIEATNGGFGGGGISGGRDGDVNCPLLGGGGGGGYSGGGAGSDDCTDDRWCAGGGGGSFIHADALSAATSDGTWDTTGSEPHDVYTGIVDDLDEWNDDHGSVTIDLVTDD